MAEKRTFTVSEVNAYLKSLLAADPLLSDGLSLWVRGEVSNFKRHTSGHLYLSLKDETSSLRAVMFRGRAASLGFAPENGLRVLARGYVSVYERDGQYQLYVEELQPDGVGSLHLAYRQLLQRLQAEGLFDPARKRPLPRLPRRVGIVTSLSGAALRDMVRVSLRRFPGARLVLSPAQVQGAEAPPQIVGALEALWRLPDVDVIIVGRGGGSLEELWAFNDERVARAIAVSPVPVISAVGHETDYTIADFAADVRASTPSAAAELAWPDREQELRQLGSLQRRLKLALQGRLRRERERLFRLAGGPSLARWQRRLNPLRQQLDDLAHRLGKAAQHRVESQRGRFGAAAGRLEALSPLAVLARGYSICRKWPGGPVIRQAAEVQVGEMVAVTLAEGELVCSVQQAKLTGR